MNDIDIILSQTTGFKYINVTFDESVSNSTASPKTYTYKTFEDFEEGDKAVVKSPYGLKVVTVASTSLELNTVFNGRIKWVVCKVDLGGFNKRSDMETELVKSVNRLRFTKQRDRLLVDLKEAIGEDGVTSLNALVRL